MIVYFDTNVWDHLDQRIGVTDWDLYRLRRAVKLGHLQIVLSFLNIEETLFIVQSQPERADARVKLILELADKQLFVLGQDEIMNNDIQSYAHQRPLQTPFLSLNPGMELDIRNLTKPEGKHQHELDEIIEETRHSKETFLQSLREGKDVIKPMADDIGVKGYPFGHYLANNTGWLLEGLAKGAGVLFEAKLRGLDGLLKLKSVGLAVGANLSLLYSHHFENRAPAPGDSRDMLHALLASTAEIFVTNDGKLEKLLDRIALDGFEVMSLRTFLAELPSWI